MPDVMPRRRVDFDLHGFVGIRLEDAAPAEIAAVQRQLGLPTACFERPPDIVCRFVDQLALRGRLRRIGRDEAGFTDDAYLVLRARHKSRARVQMPIADVGGPCTIVCERGLPAVPLLIAIVNLTALAHGYAPIHGSAFTYDGIGVLVTGWAKGGKTETLLGFMEHGARYVGDEWIYLGPSGTRMYGIPEPMKIWEYQLATVPHFRNAASAGERMRLKSLATGARASAKAEEAARGTPLAGLLRRGVPLLEQQSYVQLAPQRLFGADACDLEGPIDCVVLALSADDTTVTIEPASASEIAVRAAASVEFELGDLIRHYQRFRFAFPDASNPWLESLGPRIRDGITAALRGKGAFTLRHPFPAPIPALYEVLRPCLR